MISASPPRNESVHPGEGPQGGLPPLCPGDQSTRGGSPPFHQAPRAPPSRIQGAFLADSTLSSATGKLKWARDTRRIPEISLGKCFSLTLASCLSQEVRPRMA